jgi:hypothetical protein
LWSHLRSCPVAYFLADPTVPTTPAFSATFKKDEVFNVHALTVATDIVLDLSGCAQEKALSCTSRHLRGRWSVSRKAIAPDASGTEQAPWAGVFGRDLDRTLVDRR